MTALAKDLSSGLDLFLEVRIVALSKQEVGWKIASDKGVEYQAERVILTAPLPQSLDLLRQSQIKYQPELDKISYAKAIVALIEVENAKSDLAFENGYQEPKGGSLFSIADQKAKGLSNVAALTVTLSPDASESLYETSDDRIVEFVSSELRNLEPTFLAKTIQIKKWRYSHPLSRYPALYESPVAGLYLAGDAFGGPSLNGSARSAHALADFLTETRRPKES
jgi:renalase